MIKPHEKLGNKYFRGGNNLKAIYKITLLNWHKHNPNRKKSYKYTLISNNFYCDSKLSVLPVSHKWLLLALLLMCGNEGSDTIEVSERHLRDQLESSKSIERALDALKSLRILTWELSKLSLINRIEEKRKGIEEKRIPDTSKKSVPAHSELISDLDFKKNDPDANRRVWEAYRTSYLTRYKIEPVRNATVNSQISRLVKNIGSDESVLLVKFYLTHNDQFYVKNTHTFGHCLSSAETLRTQMLKGRAITGSVARDFEKRDVMTSQLERISKGEL